MNDQILAFIKAHPRSTLTEIVAANQDARTGDIGTAVGKLMRAGMVRQVRERDRFVYVAVLDA